MLSSSDVPVNAFKSSLYTRAELLGGYDLNDPRSYVQTLDFQAYRFFLQGGKRAVTNYSHGIVQSLHDNSMTQALLSFLEGKRVVGFMGGHDLPRGTTPYRSVALLAHRIAETGAIVVTGGGPGAMEASHVGAFYAHRPLGALTQGIDDLALFPNLPPNLGKILDPNGEVRWDIVEALHTWQAAAERLVQRIEPGQPERMPSLGIPTWLYGHEPPTVFADYTAKYFQNSIREDGLLSIANGGVIFVEGRAGTLQEVFQNTNQNYYHLGGPFRPMVFVGTAFWRSTHVLDALQALFTPEDFQGHVLATDDLDEAFRFIDAYRPTF